MMTYGYTLETVARRTLTVITREQAKAFCEIDADITAHDVVLDMLVENATDYLEQFLHSTLLETRYILHLNDWDYCNTPSRLRLPMGPVMSVQGVSYTDRDGAVQVSAESAYTLVKSPPAAELVPGYNQTWPYNRAHPGSIAIEYTAGYEGAGSPMDAAGVPGSIKQAAGFLVAHWFANREAVLTGTIATKLPLGMEDALQPYRNYFP